MDIYSEVAAAQLTILLMQVKRPDGHNVMPLGYILRAPHMAIRPFHFAAIL
jgi:hypothetical protein